jgi:hypothetical protein
MKSVTDKDVNIWYSLVLQHENINHTNPPAKQTADAEIISVVPHVFLVSL